MEKKYPVTWKLYINSCTDSIIEDQIGPGMVYGHTLV